MPPSSGTGSPWAKSSDPILLVCEVDAGHLFKCLGVWRHRKKRHAAALWVVFTVVHGPTSFDQRGEVLGRSTPFWGTLLGGIPNLLISLSWILLYSILTKSRWLARFGSG